MCGTTEKMNEERCRAQQTCTSLNLVSGIRAVEHSLPFECGGSGSEYKNKNKNKKKKKNKNKINGDLVQEANLYLCPQIKNMITHVNVTTPKKMMRSSCAGWYQGGKRGEISGKESNRIRTNR